VRPTLRSLRAAALACALLVDTWSPAASQGRPELRVVGGGAAPASVPVATEAGYRAVPLAMFERLGWTIGRLGARGTATGPDSAELQIWSGTAFFRWKGQVRQLADVPYLSGDTLLVPLQLITDFVPRWYPDRYALDTTSLTLRVSEPAAVTAQVGGASATGVAPGGSRPTPARPRSGAADSALRTPVPYDGKKVVVIDAGHGGIDPGAMSSSGIKEKTVALAIAKDLQRRLSEDSTLEVHMVRTDDHLVPLWSRGAEATKWKGKRPGLFISIHCNSYSASSRGFETYFLSDARTEHEKRVTANENAPLQLENDKPPSKDLDFILHELRNLDYQHWSALLAQMVQTDLAKVHPGPNRGVKQGPLAVITNALMPAVLVEVGYLSNPKEARLLASSDFQKKAAGALANAVEQFFQRYPPGSAGSGAGEGR